MQKVVGSSPIIRSEREPPTGGSCRSGRRRHRAQMALSHVHPRPAWPTVRSAMRDGCTAIRRAAPGARDHQRRGIRGTPRADHTSLSVDLVARGAPISNRRPGPARRARRGRVNGHRRLRLGFHPRLCSPIELTGSLSRRGRAIPLWGLRDDAARAIAVPFLARSVNLWIRADHLPVAARRAG